MPTEITMPQLGESVTEGTVGRWLKQPGDRIEKYEALLEVTTDKVDTEVPAPVAGTLREILIAEGETVRVGTLLAILDPVGQEQSASAPVLEAAQQSVVNAAPAPVAVAQTAPSSNGHKTPAPVSAAPAVDAGFISPVVRQLAHEHQIDLSQISGKGLGGRIRKKDVLDYIAQRQQAPATPAPVPEPMPATPAQVPAHAHASPPAQTPAPASPLPTIKAPAINLDELPEDAELLPISAMRRAIAEHMTLSRRTIPHVTTMVEVDVGAIIAHRQQALADFERQQVRLTYTAYFVQAIVAGLRVVPALNGSYTEQGIIQHRQINVGVAVALDDGLIVPVIQQADEKSLVGLARNIADLSERARNRRLKPEEVKGGTFTITNHGINGSIFAMPIINHPQAGILGVGTIQKRVVVQTHNGIDSMAIRPMAYLSLTFDHRLLDGAQADQFLVAVKKFIENYPTK
jgi:2-oxoisovalerate dehydrogenase E2 component (dihydrolipoyl transacylase)